MAQSWVRPRDLMLEFRAPPSSPVAGWPDSPDQEDELARFLARSGYFRVPQLILPDRIAHRTAQRLPEVDFQTLDDPSGVKNLRSAAATIGCFQVVNHGIEADLIAAAGDTTREAFAMPAEKKMEVVRSSERIWGFAVEEGWDEEELWWSPKSQSEMARMQPKDFEDNFRDKMEHLWVELESITTKIEQMLIDTNIDVTPAQHPTIVSNSSALYFHKSRGEQRTSNERSASSLEHDILRMLIKSSTCSHALALHICISDSSFHVYSKQGRVIFQVNQGSLVLTVGEQIQRRSCGLYKKVIGKHVYKNAVHRDDIYIRFLYSPPTRDKIVATPMDLYVCASDDGGKKTMSISGQVRIAICLVLLCHVIGYIYG